MSTRIEHDLIGDKEISNELEEYVWEGEDTSAMNMRALIKRLRKKLPLC